MKAFFITLILCPNLWAADGTEKWAKKIIELRSEVELLNEDYKSQKERAQNQLKSLALQKAELESNLRSEKIKNRQLNDKWKQMKDSLKGESIENQSLLPLLEEAMGQMKAYIESSLPFKTKERLLGVKDLKKRLDQGEITAVKASNQLWALIEDEKRLARETSLHKQTIPLSGAMKLAEVAKVGMQFLYFRTDDQDYGMAQYIDGEWRFIAFRDEAKKQQALVFMDSLKKQIRQGYFDLPTEI